MHNTLCRLAGLVVAALMQGGLVRLALAQVTPARPSVGEPLPQYAAPGSEPPAIPAAPPETAAQIELPVLYVTSVEVLRTTTDPRLDIVRVTGLAKLKAGVTRNWFRHLLASQGTTSLICN